MVHGILQDLISAKRKKRHTSDRRFIITDTLRCLQTRFNTVDSQPALRLPRVFRFLQPRWQHKSGFVHRAVRFRRHVPWAALLLRRGPTLQKGLEAPRYASVQSHGNNLTALGVPAYGMKTSATRSCMEHLTCNNGRDLTFR